MKHSKLFMTFLLISCIIFLSASFAQSGAPAQVQRSVTPAAPAPAIQPESAPQTAPQPASQPAPQQIRKPVVINYDMAIENLSLTSQCQVTFTIRNTGANLSVDQHKNSKLKIGNNAPMSLATFDPAGKLRTKGNTMIYLENTPITKNTNMMVTVTLFNNKKITKNSFLKPTCGPKPQASIPVTPAAQPKTVPAATPEQSFTPAPAPPQAQPTTPTKVMKPTVMETQETAPPVKKITPKQAEVQPVTPQVPPPGIPAQMTPMSGDTGMGTKLKAMPGQILSLPQTILQVERMGGDLQTWDSWAGTDTSQQKMRFRWKTEIEKLLIARWEVSLSPNFPYVIAQGGVTSVPPKGTYGQFYIDLGSFSGTYTKPVTFYFRVKPVKTGGIQAVAVGSETQPAVQTSSIPSTPSSAEDEGLDPSTVARVTLVEAGSGPVTEFNLPERHLMVVLTKVKVVDDSDDLSGGDLSFRLTVEGKSAWKDFYDDDLDTGETHDLGNLSVTVTDPPNFAHMTIYGCDDDDEPGAFTSSAHCGNDPDTASVSYNIPTGKNMGRWKIPQTPFSLSAHGSSLKYDMQGYYEMYCDPCP